MAKKDDPHYNASGYYDETAFEAICKADQEIESNDRKRIYDLIGEIYDVVNKAGFRVEGRIVLRDLKTGRIWR